MRLALVADWLPVYAGAEHVLAALHDLWPHAPIHTTVARRGAIGPLDGADIRTTRLQWLYRFVGKHQLLLPWMPRAIEDIDLRGYDVIVSSSHAVGKGIVPPSNALHVCYCHTPMRYAWEMEDEYLRDFHVPAFLLPRAKRMLKALRRWDLTTAKRVDLFLANSKETAGRIRRVYGRASIVIPPPVDERFFGIPVARNPGSYFLTIGRLVPYKRIDLLVRLATRYDLPLKIAGTGSEEKRLKTGAGPTVEFLGFVSDEQLPELYTSARAVLFPAHEDAGVVPLEAQACGTPVIAYGRGGAADSVIDGVTGVLVREQTVEALRAGVERMNDLNIDRNAIRARAREFGVERFKQRLHAAVMAAVDKSARAAAGDVKSVSM